MVGSNLLPSGLPESLVPPRVATILETVPNETYDNNRLKASFAVAIKMAKECNFDLKVSSPMTSRKKAYFV